MGLPRLRSMATGLGATPPDACGGALTRLRVAAVLGAVVFALCLLGILSRSPGTLAAFWPANAVLLGLLVRRPAAATPAMWIFVAAGYVAADLLTGGSIASSLLLNGANLVGVAAGFYVFGWLGPRERRLASIASVGYLVALAATASVGAAVIGGYADTILFAGTWTDGAALWFATEFVHYMTIVPMILAAPTHHRPAGAKELRPLTSSPGTTLRRTALPAALLIGCMALGWCLGGAGAIAFTMPALVAAALLTNVFTTTVFIAASTTWALLLAADGHLGLPAVVPVPVSASIQIGLALLAIGPIAVACVITERRHISTALRIAVTRDDLTGALRRGEFFRRGEKLLENLRRHSDVVSVMMFDLDHFKHLNDTHGHSAGDTALIDFADHVRHHLTGTDLFARLGGEEFALLTTGQTLQATTDLAEAIRAAQQHHTRHTHGDDGPTVSIGIFHTTGPFDLDTLLATADHALYQAKTRNRNTIVTITTPTPSDTTNPG